jgi:hydroxymethylglutaryl-CoA synthase
MLGFSMDQIKPGLVSPKIGNTYAGSTPVGIAAILDVAEPEDKIFAVSYGSGSGSDAFIFTVQDAIREKRKGPSLSSFIERKEYVDYSTYLRHRRQIIQ